MSKAQDTLREAIRDSGLSPGRYRILEDSDYVKLSHVQRLLCELIEDSVSGLKMLDVCAQLYLWHEQVMLRDKTESGTAAIANQALRSLIELAVKSCHMTGGEADEGSFEYALALAQGVIYWDVVWDQLSSQLVSHYIEIGEDYVPRPRDLPELDHVTNRYQQYLAERKRANEIWQDDALLLPSGMHERESVRLWLEDLGLSELDRYLDAECGYSLVDYYRFIDVLVKRAVIEGYDVLALDRSEFVSECLDAHGIRESAVTALLDDFSLSRRVIGDVPTVDIFSVGRRKRDSRFLRRPIIELVYEGRPALVYGVETLIEAAELFRKYILAGRIPVELWRHNRAVDRAFGRIRDSVGAPFEEAIARDCAKIVGKDCVVLGKDFISGVKTAPDLGEVDVFVVDRRHRRFVLAETKNGAAAGGVPLSMLDERREFLDSFLPKLKEKSAWFRSHVSELKREFGIPAEEVFKFEEVIVVNQLQLWVLLSGQALPVLDDDEFLAKLGAGQDLLSDPALRSSETS